MHTTFVDFRRHFERNAARPLPPTLRLATRDEIPNAARLARSLARFHLGETGEGRIAHQIDRTELPGVDADYRAALKLFVKEEGRHARILAGLVRALGGELLHATTSSRLFTYGRRLAGVRLKLLVLLVAEVVSIVCYQALAARLPDGDVRRGIAQIAKDERMHLRFHMRFFAFQIGASRLARAIFASLVALVAFAAAVTVLIDHGALLAELGAPRRRVMRGVLRMTLATQRGIAPARFIRPDRLLEPRGDHRHDPRPASAVRAAL